MKKKNTAPSMEQWAKLYEVATTIKHQAPWNTLWDTDLVTIMLPGQNEPVFISVMGRNGECYGIGVYPGYRGITGFYRLLDSSEEDLQINPLSFQNCLMCYYGDRCPKRTGSHKIPEFEIPRRKQLDILSLNERGILPMVHQCGSRRTDDKRIAEFLHGIYASFKRQNQSRF